MQLRGHEWCSVRCPQRICAHARNRCAEDSTHYSPSIAKNSKPLKLIFPGAEFLWSLDVEYWSLLRAKRGYFWVHAIRAAGVARSKDARRRSEISRRPALQP